MMFWNWMTSLFKAPVFSNREYQWTWSNQLKLILEGKVETFAAASDINKLHPQFRILSRDHKLNILVEFFKWLSYYESGWNYLSQSVDVGIYGKKDTYSIGLLQLSVIDQTNLNINLGYDYDTLIQPIPNLTLGVEIMLNQIRKRGKIFIPKEEKGNPGLYWATLCPNGKYDKSEQIIKKVHEMTSSDKIVIIDTPWMDIANKEIGIQEIEGHKHNHRIIEYHSVTTLKATEDEVPWCASFVSWCLEKANIISTKDAWARSYLNWGVKIDKPIYGCICVFSRGSTSGHVAFYISENENQITVLGGNQSDKVCISSYPKERLLSYRMPKK